MSQLQRHPDTHEAMLVPVSYCEPTFSDHDDVLSMSIEGFVFGNKVLNSKYHIFSIKRPGVYLFQRLIKYLAFITIQLAHALFTL